MKKYIFPEITFCDFKADSTIADVFDNVNATSIGTDSPWDPDVDE